jgi:U3 small nucleolar RNA-associated protein 12
VLISGHADGTVRLWEPATRKEKASLRGHASAVTALAVAGDGLVLASGGADCSVVLWDLATETGMYRLRGHTQPVSGIAFAAGTGAEGTRCSGGGGLFLSCLKVKT